MLCSTPPGKQHSGTFPHPVLECHRRLHQVVERQTCTEGYAPWSLTPNLQLQLKQFLRSWHVKVLAHQVPCHTPSFRTVFIKHAAVLDQLCNHKQTILDWSTSNPAICSCKHWDTYKTAALNPSDPLGPSWILASIPCVGGTCSHCRRLPAQQSLSVQKGIS